jgi:chromosome segregation ATPase
MSNDEMTTRPTIDTILVRLDEWGTRFKIEFSGIHEGQDSLRKSIEELRNGQSELRQSVEELRNGQGELRQSVEELRNGQGELRQSVEELRNGQGELRQSVEELRNSQEDLRKGQEALRTDLNTGLRRIERKIEILNDNLLTINADIRDLEVRLEKLESASELKG